MPASVVALLLRHIKKTKMLFDLFASLASLCLLGIIIVPIYFIYNLKVSFLLFYIIIVIAYSVSFLMLICSVCAIRDTCPAAKVSSNLLKF